jgi:hypothetical protein
VWRGRQREGRDVLVAFKSMRYSLDTDALFRYDVPGIARFVYFGDAGRGEVAIAEELPDGMSLAEVGHLDEQSTIQLGIDMCATALAWAERREHHHIGLRPEYYLHCEWAIRGHTPRTECLLGRDYGYFEAPAESFGLYKPDDLGFLVARLMWIAPLGDATTRTSGPIDDAGGPDLRALAAFSTRCCASIGASA